MPDTYDAILFVSFGGPEGKEDVIPFLENVLRGKNVPRERMLEVAEHYYQFDGISPINEQNRLLIDALTSELREHGVELPVYWGNRNWRPLLTDTMQQMKEDGVQRALAFVTSAHSSYSGCRQYRENIQHAQERVGEGAPEVHKLRVFYNHPGYIETMVDRVEESLAKIPESRRAKTRIIYTAHSIPESMSAGCDYAVQLNESCRLIDEKLGDYESVLVFQSRSGPPSQPWLEPDICDYLDELRQTGDVSDVIVVPIGFISDHMEVLFDLDHEAKEFCDAHGINMIRAKTAGTHPRFVAMIRELIGERTSNLPREALGDRGANHDVCPEDCCLSGRAARTGSNARSRGG